MISQALQNLRPNAEWVLRGEEIEWLDAIQSRPSDMEIAAEVARLEAEYIKNEYQRERAKAYPSFADQFDLLYHGGLDSWKAAIDAVKTRYPKPNEG